jgi:hypothetical protein
LGAAAEVAASVGLDADQVLDPRANRSGTPLPRRGGGAILIAVVCVQCVGTAVTVGAGATGLRAFVAARQPRWLTPARLRLATAILITAGILAVGIRV